MVSIIPWDEHENVIIKMCLGLLVMSHDAVTRETQGRKGLFISLFKLFSGRRQELETAGHILSAFRKQGVKDEGLLSVCFFFLIPSRIPQWGMGPAIVGMYVHLKLQIWPLTVMHRG